MKEVNSKLAPDAVGPYSQAIRTGNRLYLSGQLGLDKEKGSLLAGVEEQTKQAFKNISYILEAEGLSLSNVVKVTVLLADINDFAKVNAIYAEHFTKPYPARSAFAVKDLPLGASIEIEVIAEIAQ